MAVELFLQRDDNTLEAGGCLLHDVACHLHMSTHIKIYSYVIKCTCRFIGIEAYSVDVSVVQGSINLIQHKEWGRLIAVQ